MTKEKIRPKITERFSIAEGTDSMGRKGRHIYEPWGETKEDFRNLYPERRSSFTNKNIEVLAKWGVEFDVVDKDGNIVRRITGC